jgi:hypothetical protein
MDRAPGLPDGERVAREPRPPRDARAPREPRAPRAESGPRPLGEDRPVARDVRPMESYGEAPEAREGMDDAGNVAPREVRAPRDDRAPRTDRGPDRGPGREGGGRDRGRGRGRDRGRDRDFRNEPREPLVDPKTLPSPLTGNPVIYDMRSGKPKNRTDAEFRAVLNEYNDRVAGPEEKSPKKKAGPAIIKKISSKVTALFGRRGE